MEIYTTTEEAYKKGYADGKRDLINKLLNVIRDDIEINGWNFSRIKSHILDLED